MSPGAVSVTASLPETKGGVVCVAVFPAVGAVVEEGAGAGEEVEGVGLGEEFFLELLCLSRSSWRELESLSEPISRMCWRPKGS